jgi:hypothetical protein
MLVVLKDYP